MLMFNIEKESIEMEKTKNKRVYCKLCNICGWVHTPADTVCQRCGSGNLRSICTNLKIKK